MTPEKQTLEDGKGWPSLHRGERRTIKVSLSGPAEVKKEVNFQVRKDFNICAIISTCAKTFVETDLGFQMYSSF